MEARAAAMAESLIRDEEEQASKTKGKQSKKKKKKVKGQGSIKASQVKLPPRAQPSINTSVAGIIYKSTSTANACQQRPSRWRWVGRKDLG